MKVQQDYIRSLIFGFEDGLVSTTGAVVGVSAGTQDPNIVALTGIVVIAVESLSMGVGQYLSERSTHQLEPQNHQDSLKVGAVTMFVSYFVAGLVPVVPVLLFGLPLGIIVAITAALVALFGLGYFKGKYVKVSAARSGLEMLLLGGGAMLIGSAVGYLFRV
ncbi:MAG: VIT1/CCC1 transporter family protein [Candidatus Saccharimonadales bacterium]